MSPQKHSAAPPDLAAVIFTVRGRKAILDADLARIYGVPTKRLNEQIKRNAERFPADFAFQLTAEEWRVLRSQFATTSAEPAQCKPVVPIGSQFATRSALRRSAAFRPVAFTEHGAIMAANVLNSARAIQMSVFVVRAFVKMRDVLQDSQELARKLAALEKDLKSRLDVHEAAIVDILQRVMQILDPPPPPPEPPKPEIGFHTTNEK